ncbi:hypothetical protein FPOAC2_07275 [Fusarium poae]|uniref:hypothetical protein n=1 Tax=Fusarium poae TaxID=36050 RepID=UPI001CE9EF02|nr:hypothetical protein FPOAC1_007123 [Fusarium poae]KAG8673804.1 hypothetical protein FPOAC1_007123 [Fusarium poae]
MELPILFSQPHTGPGCRHGYRLESQKAAYSPLPHNIDDLPDQYSIRDVRDLGRPLCEVALFQTPAISSSLANPPSKTTRKRTHTSSSLEASVGTDVAQDNLYPVLRAHNNGAVRGSKVELHEKLPKSIKPRKCSICNTTETPKWRTGPFGPGSFCNFCGLVYAKRRARLDITHKSG